MKPIIALFLTMCFFGGSSLSQRSMPMGASLPAWVGNWKGEDSDKLLNDRVIVARLKKLMGKKNYASFMDSFETLDPITRYGDVLFSSGCLIHACTHLESAIAIDLKNRTIHVAIFNAEKPTRYFNERGLKSPAAIVNWATNLNNLKRDNLDTRNP